MTHMTDNAAPLTPAVFHVLLSLVNGPHHGYAIMKAVAASSGQTMGPGTIYGSLRRLTDAGWVEEIVDTDGASDTRRGKSFQLTEAGGRALAQEAQRITHLAGLDLVRRLAAESPGQ